MTHRIWSLVSEELILKLNVVDEVGIVVAPNLPFQSVTLTSFYMQNISFFLVSMQIGFSVIEGFHRDLGVCFQQLAP